MIVVVTQRHINRGIRNNLKACPIALAMKDVVRQDDKVRAADVMSFDEKLRVAPQAAKIFMTLFDKGLPVRPFSFKI